MYRNDSRGLFCGLPGQVGDEVVAVEMDLVGHVADLVALEQLLLHLRVAGHGQKGRQPVEVGDDLVGHLPGLILPGQRTMAGTR